jgi:L-amino acid N-acyltransferase YncA
MSLRLLGGTPDTVGEVTTLLIRRLRPTDWPPAAAIYREGVQTGLATFEHGVPSWIEFDASKLPEHRLVAIGETGALLGWVAAYEGVVEHSIYVAAAERGKGVGRALLQAVIDSTEAAGLWTLQATIFPENTSSIALHEKLGFRVIGTRERIARLVTGEWQDVVLLERRSTIVG